MTKKNVVPLCILVQFVSCYLQKAYSSFIQLKIGVNMSTQDAKIRSLICYVIEGHLKKRFGNL